MKQAIAGVAPAQSSEVTVMTVWPSIATSALGRLIGTVCGIRWPDVYCFRLGYLLAVAMIPPALGLYFARIVLGQRYTLTNRRIVVSRGLKADAQRAINLDQFDEARIEQSQAQRWYDAGDLVLLKDEVEQFRLPAVSRPEPFRHTCLKAQRSYVGVSQVLQKQQQQAVAAN